MADSLPAGGLPVSVAPGLVVLVPDYDNGPSAPAVPALVVRVLDRGGAMGGLVDVIVLGRPYDPDGGFRFGKDLAPYAGVVTAAMKAAAWDAAVGALAVHAPGWNYGMNA